MGWWWMTRLRGPNESDLNLPQTWARLMMKCKKRTGPLLGALFVGILIFVNFFLYSTRLIYAASESLNTTSAETETQPKTSAPWYSKIEMQWGGRIRVLGAISQYDDGTIYHAVQDDPYLDGNADFRLNNDTYFNPETYITENEKRVPEARIAKNRLT